MAAAVAAAAKAAEELIKEKKRKKRIKDKASAKAGVADSDGLKDTASGDVITDKDQGEASSSIDAARQAPSAPPVLMRTRLQGRGKPPLQRQSRHSTLVSSPHRFGGGRSGGRCLLEARI